MMRHDLQMLTLVAPLLALLASLAGQTPVAPSDSKPETPITVAPCELNTNPGVYNHKLISVTGFVSQGFEDFTLQDPECPEAFGPWLEFGGTVNSGVISCCGPTNKSTRPQQLTVENIPIPLAEDNQLQLLIKQLRRPTRESNLVHATLVGRFFAGHPQNGVEGKTYWSGFGHMSCCSLLAIQQVTQVDANDSPNLDHDPWATFPYTPEDKVGCGYTGLLPLNPMQEMLKAQRTAEASEPWAFDQPDKVASESLSHLAKLPDSPALVPDNKHTTPARRVYTWHPPHSRSTYTVILSRPYWLSFYSALPNHVAWVIRSAFLSSCDKNNSVTRIR